jgi:hypothetical protein
MRRTHKLFLLNTASILKHAPAASTSGSEDNDWLVLSMLAKPRISQQARDSSCVNSVTAASADGKLRGAITAGACFGGICARLFRAR